MNLKLRRWIFWPLLTSFLLLSACAKAPPQHIENICTIFNEYPSWYWDALDVRKQWGLPVSVLMAIIYQESHFRADAKPPREHILWVIPWKRPTSAYGYSQALKNTWRQYRDETGHQWSSRDTFGDAADFIGWFTHTAHERAGIPMNDAYRQYLAYHEGVGGYLQHSYQNKAWLVEVARKVQRRANVYKAQLLACQDSLPQPPWYRSL